MTSSSARVSESDSYEEICDQLREQGRGRYGSSGYSRIVFTNGCFDVLHLGHLRVLDECRMLAGPKGAVIVGVNSDSSVRRLKGPSRPIFDERTRCLMLVHLKPVDYVVTFDEDTPLKFLEFLRPDIVVKGGDWKNKEVVGSSFAAVVLVPVEGELSTTSIIERIKKSG